jgi:hypothetical protein
MVSVISHVGQQASGNCLRGQKALLSIMTHTHSLADVMQKGVVDGGNELTVSANQTYE